MARLRDLQKSARQLAKDWAKIRSQALDNTKEQALDIITDDQLFAKGIDGTGNKLPLPYAPFTIDIKRSKGQPINRITLNDTGDFYDGVFGKVFGDNILTGSTDSKSGELHQQWGSEILSMTKANAEIYGRKIVLPEVQEIIRKKLNV